MIIELDKNCVHYMKVVELGQLMSLRKMLDHVLSARKEV